MSEGMQITIPDFDGEEYSTTPIPFGRSAGQAFSFGIGTGSGQDSPIATTSFGFTERAERSFFSHNRGDSVTSDDSTHSVSTRFATVKSGTPFAHSSQSSITSPSPITKKNSFASIRNAFKSHKSNDAPPVPQIDHQTNSILKNSFNRSASSLNYGMSISRPSPANASPPYPRPPTPGSSNEARFARAGSAKAKSHAYSKSQHSHAGSTVHHLDAGSDHGHGYPYSSSPPPVPRVPNAFGNNLQRTDTPPMSDFEEDKIIIDPKTPSDYALHAVFIRFAASAELKIDAFLRHGLDQDPLLPNFMGLGVDAKFDEFLQSLSRIAQKYTKPVVDSIMRWRRSQNETVGMDIIRYHTTHSPEFQRNLRTHDVPSLLNERKSLASIYIMCRALIAVLQPISKDALGELLGYSLEETTFEQFRRPDLKLLAQSANHRTNAELYATLLGLIANVRFVSVTDRFLGELGPVASGQVPKDLDMKYENLVSGLKHIQIKVWPPEAFEEGAEFLESLSKSFGNAHGLRLKTTFCETLLHLLHPIGKTAQAEVNHPQWAKAIEIIYLKVKEMVTKPRYWHVAYPLLITSLCVAPHQFFLKHWSAAFEAGLSKLKEKPFRIPVMNGMIRLIWTYLYRCQEPATTAIAKLESLLKHFFPPNRTSIFPNDDQLDPFIYITHFVLSRHLEYGRDLCLDLMQESMINVPQSTHTIPIAAERTTIAIEAILLSLHLIEKDETSPTWPSCIDFSVVPSREDYPSSSGFVPLSFSSKPGMQQFFDRCGSTLGVIAIACANSVGSMSMIDDQWSYPRTNISYEERNNFVIRQHPGGTVAYPTNMVSQISMLRACFQAWPRCLHPTVPLGDAIDMLIRGVIHVEPSVGDAACAALQRILVDPQHALSLLSRVTSFIFNPARITRETSGVKFLPEYPQLLNLWVNIVDGWIRNIFTQPKQLLTELDKTMITSRISEIEAGALFLLSYQVWDIHAAGVKIVRMLSLLVAHTSLEPPSHSDAQDMPIRFLDLLKGKGLEKLYLHGYDDLLDKLELGRLEQWRQSTRDDTVLRMADSKNDKDRRLWQFAFPLFLQSCMDHRTHTLGPFREALVAAVSRYHPLISHIAGLSSRAPIGLPARPQLAEKDGRKLVQENMHLVDQWHIWVKILCSTATLSESRPALTQIGREHTRAPSDTNFERERLTTTRGLFRYLTPFLDSEYTCFREAAVLCVSSFPSAAYPQLLEDLSLLAARQFYDESRVKLGSSQIIEQNLNFLAGRQIHDESKSKNGATQVVERSRRQERLHSGVARIYYITARFLQNQRSTGKQAALANVLKFVRNTQAFLTTPEIRDSFPHQRLRHYFCGTVERLFDSLLTLKESDRIIPPNMPLTLYRLCEEWCQFGLQSDAVKRRFLLLQRSAAAAATDPHSEPDAVERFTQETILLSNAAVGAMASLCQKAFYPPQISSSSPTDRPVLEYSKALSTSSTLERWSAVLSSSQVHIQNHGKRGLRWLLTANVNNPSLLSESLTRAVVTSKDLDSTSGRFFELISDIICNTEEHKFTFSQVVCLGLSNLCHPLLDTRRLAFNILEAIHEQSSGILSMSQFEATVGSLAPSTYLHAHRLISDFLAGEHPLQASDVLSRFSYWLQHIHDIGSRVTLLLLQSLELWIPNIELMTENKTGLSREGVSAVYHLVALTLRFGQSHSQQVSALWNRLVEPPHHSNGHATVRFLLEQSHKVGSTVFISCAANVVACLCETAIGKQIFEELCSVVEPARMLPTIDHKLAFPDADDMELWSDLDDLFAEQPRLSLSAAQFALLFLADAALDRQWEQQTHLPILLHAIFIHLDHRTPFVRQQARRMLFQLLRAWVPGYDELPNPADHPNRSAMKSALAKLEQDSGSMFWKEDETSVQSEPKMKWLCTQVLNFLGPLAPKLAKEWGSLALTWGTACSIRATAFRSLQIFRALMPRVTKADLALLLGRLSNTIAAPIANIQSFTSEIALTLTSLAESDDFDMSLSPQMFWCAIAGLSTTVEAEFGQVLLLLHALMTRIDLDDPDTADLLISHRPPDWTGSVSLQSSLLTGLRSSTTVKDTMKILKTLAKFDDARLIDVSEGRVRDLYTVSLPWCLHAMTSESQDGSLQEFAINIGRLAQKEGRDSIQRIMTSFAKNRFRTKDDFLRQSVASLREHYGTDHWTEVVTLLLGLVLNRDRWLRVQSMQILKVLFQQKEIRNPVGLLGSELLMPLLRLLETDLASQALGVLEEPITISGGPSAKDVLRMSMHVRSSAKTIDSVADVFGLPEESGWCVPRPDALREICRSNVMAVFDTCKMSSRPSRIDFEPEIVGIPGPLEEDLGDLVQNLHELTTFFQEDEPSRVDIPMPMPSQQLEARVAAILAKSTSSDIVTDVPPTPFLDVFRVGGGVSTSDDSDADSGTDSELDAFIFDSPSIYHAAPKSSRLH